MNTLNNNTVLQCSFGLAPAKVVLFVPKSRVLTQKMPTGDSMQTIPMASIPSFVLCRSPANPMVIAATAAAMGVLTPMPCIPNPVGPWIIGNPKLLLGSLPALSQKHRILCAYGGCISTVLPGALLIQQ